VLLIPNALKKDDYPSSSPRGYSTDLEQEYRFTANGTVTARSTASRRTATHGFVTQGRLATGRHHRLAQPPTSSSPTAGLKAKTVPRRLHHSTTADRYVLEGASARHLRPKANDSLATDAPWSSARNCSPSTPLSTSSHDKSSRPTRRDQLGGTQA